MKVQLKLWLIALAFSLEFVATAAQAQTVPYFCNSVKSEGGQPLVSVIVADLGTAYSKLLILGDSSTKLYETIRRLDSYHFFTKEASMIIQKEGRIVESEKVVPAEFREHGEGKRVEMVCVESFNLNQLRQ